MLLQAQLSFGVLTTLTSVTLTQSGTCTKHYLPKLSSFSLDGDRTGPVRNDCLFVSWEPGQDRSEAWLYNTKGCRSCSGFWVGDSSTTLRSWVGWCTSWAMFLYLHGYCKMSPFFYLKKKSLGGGTHPVYQYFGGRRIVNSRPVWTMKQVSG